MKQVQIQRGCLAVLCLVAMLGFSGCNSDDNKPPDNISGAWTGNFTRGAESHLQKPWTFSQNGQTVTGTYIFDVTTWSFTGTYVDGVFNGIDTDNWVLHLEFEENSAVGTVTGDGEVWNAELTR